MPENPIPTPEQFLAKQKNSIPTPDEFLKQNSSAKPPVAAIPKPPDPKITKIWGNSDKVNPGSQSDMLLGYAVNPMDLLKDLNAGAASMLSGLAQAPGYVYDAFSTPLNYVMSGKFKDDLLAVPNVGSNKTLQSATDYIPVSSDRLKGEIKATAGPGIASTMADTPALLKKKLNVIVDQNNRETEAELGPSIEENFRNGDYGKAFQLATRSVFKSVPTMAGLMLGNMSGLTSTQATLLGGAVFGANKKAELDEKFPDMPEDKKILSSAISGLSEGFIESNFGLTKIGSEIAKVFKNGGVEAGKQVAEQAFKDVYLPVIKKHLGNFGEEVGSEVFTQYIDNVRAIYIDGEKDRKLTDGLFDAAVTAGLMSGPIVSTVGAIEASQKKQKFDAQKQIVDRDREQSEHALEVAKGGTEKIAAFKDQVNEELKKGNLTPEQADQAYIRVDAYKEYSDLLQKSNIDVGDKEQELYDKAFQKQLLEREIATQLAEAGNDVGKMHPLLEGQYQTKKKLAEDIQKDINQIMLNGEVKKQPTVGEKTLNDLQKKEEKIAKENEPAKPGEIKKKVKESPEVKSLREKYQNKGKWKKEDTRPFEDIPVAEYNSPDMNDRVKHQKTFEFLQAQPNQKAYGVVAERPFFDGDNKNSVLGIELPDGKKLRFSSSMNRKDGWAKGHFRIERWGEKEFPLGTPIGMKAYEVEDEAGNISTHIKGFRRDNGKFIGWLKKTHSGSYNPDPLEKEQLERIEDTNESDEDLELFNQPTQPGPVAPKQLKVYSKEAQSDGSISNSEKPVDLEAEYNSKSVEELFALKKKLYPNPDITSPMSAEEKLLDKVIAKKFSEKNEEIKAKRNKVKEEPKVEGDKNPLKDQIFYHGTKVDFKEFSEEYQGSTDQGWYGKGFYFHSDKDRGGYGDIVKVAKLNLKNPIILPVENAGKYLYDLMGEKAWIDKSFRNKSAMAVIKEIGSDEFSKIAKELGYDGVVVNYAQGTKEVVVFDKKNIELQAQPLQNNKKSATLVTQNVTDGKEKDTTDGKKSTTGDTGKADKKDSGSSKARTLRTGTKQANQKIKHSEHLLALKQPVESPIDAVQQYFINKGKIKPDRGEVNGPKGLKSLWKNSNTEFNKRLKLTNKNAPGLKEIAHMLWERHIDDLPNATDMDYYNALEEVLNNFISATEMARDINKRHAEVESQQFSPEEKIINQELDKIEDPRDEENTEKAIDILESKEDEEIVNLAEGSQQEVWDWIKEEKVVDITKDDGKPAPFQKKSSKKGDVEKVAEVIKKNFPKVKVVFDADLDAAGALNKDTITINPYYAGTDTPIHEAAHILLDAMGDNKVVQAAVAQLKGTDLWKEIKERYKELDEKGLENEVLAEAIGREGAGIFKTEVETNKFIQLLDYIFDWFKTKLGVNRNIAKSLARQIIGGIGTKDLSGQSIKNQDKVKEFSAYSADYFEYVPTSELLPYLEDKETTPGLVEDIKRNGIGVPVTLQVDHYGKALITEGRARVAAAKKLGIKSIPVKIVEKDFNGNDPKAKFLKKDENVIVSRMKELLEQGRKDAINGPYAKGFTRVIPRKYQLTEENFNLFEHDIVENEADALKRMDNGEILYTFNDSSQDPIIMKDIKEVNLYGYGNMWSASERKFQKPKNNKDYNYFRDKYLGRDSEQEQEDLKNIAELLKDPELTAEEKAEIKQVRNSIMEQIREDRDDYAEYLAEKKRLEKIALRESLEGVSIDDLIRDYHKADKFEEKEAKLRIGVYLDQIGKERLRAVVPDIDEKANTKNFTFLEKWNKVLSNVSEYYPPIQELHKLFEQKYLDMVQDMNKLKARHERLGKAVIKEKNGMLGVASDLIRTNSVKYFDYLDDGGKLRTNTTGLTKAQKEYLEFIRDLVKDRNEILDEDGFEMDNTLIRIDPGFWETWNRKEYKQALSLLLPKKANESLSWNGALTSRFDRPYKGESYSKDFYKAANLFIEDMTHVKYMKDLVPVVDGIEQFYEKVQKDEKVNLKNVIGFLEEWKKFKLYQEPGQTISPGIDASLRTLRSLVSTTVMGFNLPANLANVVIGNVNTAIKDGLGKMGTGLIRLSSKKGYSILKAYDVIKTDYDSNPKNNLNKIFTTAAFAGLRLGEIQIQGTAFLGKIDPKDYKKFKVVNGELAFTGTPEEKKAIDQKFIKYKNEVSDIQGKYADKDKGNALKYEWAKNLLQFKIYMSAFFKDKAGPEFTNSFNETKRGTFRYTKKAREEFRKQWESDGIAAIWKNEQTMSNLRYLMAFAAFSVLAYAGTDEEKNKKRIRAVDNALSSLLFVFDLQQMRYLVDSPFAAQGPVLKLLDALDGLIKGNEKKFKKNAKKLVPYNKITEIPEQVESLAK